MTRRAGAKTANGQKEARAYGLLPHQRNLSLSSLDQRLLASEYRWPFLVSPFLFLHQPEAAGLPLRENRD